MSANPSPIPSRLPALAASIPMIIVPVTVLSILLTAAMSLHLSPAETSSLIVSVYALPALLGLALTLRYHQPLIFTGNVFALIFIATLGGQITYPELVGASVLAGAIVVLIGAAHVTDRLAMWLPAPIVLGVLAGALLPWLSGVFTAFGSDPLLIGGTLLTYVLARRYVSARIPALLPALIVGLLLTGLTGRFGQFPGHQSLSAIAFTSPTFTLQGIASATPVLVVLILVQSNLPSLVYLKSQGYHPPERATNVISGAGTLLGSLIGPTAVSLPLPLIPLAAGPDAGDRRIRHWSIYVTACAMLAIGFFAGIAADLPTVIPMSLLLTLAGLGTLNVITGALQAMTRGPLVLGPIVAFAIALSKMSFLGLGPFFWSLVLGMLVSVLLERKELAALRATSAKVTQTVQKPAEPARPPPATAPTDIQSAETG